MYVVNDALVQEQIRNIPKFDKQNVLDVIEKLKSDPYHACDARPMTGGYSGYWRCKAGDWRIIYDIQEHTVTVLLMKIGRRNKVYSDYEGKP